MDEEIVKLLINHTGESDSQVMLAALSLFRASVQPGRKNLRRVRNVLSRELRHVAPDAEFHRAVLKSARRYVRAR